MNPVGARDKLLPNDCRDPAGEVFVLSREDIQREIEVQGASWTAGETPFSALSVEEMARRLGVRDRPAAVRRALADATTITPAEVSWPSEFDWRNNNGITPVKNQLDCGSCVAFGVVGALESAIVITTGQPLNLSEADLYFCGPNPPTCESGWEPNDALDRLQSRGVCDTQCCPWVINNGTGSCEECLTRESRAVKSSGQQHYASTDSMKLHISSIGPLIATLDVYEDLQAHYIGGIYAHLGGDYVGAHCVEVIGYDDSLPSHWICKNSWGQSWARAGFSASPMASAALTT